jgi:hypothetical protein
MASGVWEELNLTEDGAPTTLISGKTQVVLKSEVSMSCLYGV